MQKYLFIFVLILSTSCTSGQTALSGSLRGYIDSIVTVMPATEFSNEYQEPTTGELNSWGAVVQNILNGNYSAADSVAALISYKLYTFTDTSYTPDKMFYLLAKSSAGANYWGSFIFNPAPLRQKVVVQSPHPLFDTHTGKQGIEIFKTLGARVYCISGAHRCNSSDSTTCAGTTSVCTGLTNVKFRKSDPPHNVNATFQRTTEILNASISGLIVIQNHGFAKDTGDPDLIMSNGVAKTPATDYLALVKSALLQMDSAFTFKVLHVDTTWNTLTGTTNVQGRLINGSSNPCGKSASVNTGRFLHIEQAYSKLRDSESHRARLGSALASAFPEDPLPVELAAFSVTVQGCAIIINWETATELNSAGFYVQRRLVHVDGSATLWQNLHYAAGSGNANVPTFYRFTDTQPMNGILEYRLLQLDNDGSTTAFAAKAVVFNENQPVNYTVEVFPNPFNAAAKIIMVIPEDGLIDLTLYDLLGRKIRTIMHGIAESGRLALALDANTLGSGVYYLHLTGNRGAITKKIVIMK